MLRSVARSGSRRKMCEWNCIPRQPAGPMASRVENFRQAPENPDSAPVAVLPRCRRPPETGSGPRMPGRTPCPQLHPVPGRRFHSDRRSAASPRRRGQRAGPSQAQRLFVQAWARRARAVPQRGAATERSWVVRHEPAARSSRHVHRDTARLRIRYVSQGSSAWPALVWAFSRQQCRDRATAA